MFSGAVTSEIEEKTIKKTFSEKQMCNSHQKTKVDKIDNNGNNRSLIIGAPNCAKIYPMKYFLLQKQKQVLCGSSEAVSFYVVSKIIKSIPQYRSSNL